MYCCNVLYDFNSAVFMHSLDAGMIEVSGNEVRGFRRSFSMMQN